MKHSMAFAILAISLCASTGCTTMSDVGANMKRSMQMFRPRPFDDTTGLDEAVEDEWGKMMSEARPVADRQPDPESSWMDKLMSPQARSIENSLGI